MLTQAVSFQDQKSIHGYRAATLPVVARTPPNIPPSVPEGNIYFQKSLQSESTIVKYKGAKANEDVEIKMGSKKVIRYPYNIEYNFVSRFPVVFQGCYNCGREDHICREDCAQGIKNQTDYKLFMNVMWAHKPHTKTKGLPVGGHANFASTQNGNNII